LCRLTQRREGFSNRRRSVCWVQSKNESYGEFRQERVDASRAELPLTMITAQSSNVRPSLQALFTICRSASRIRKRRARRETETGPVEAQAGAREPTLRQPPPLTSHSRPLYGPLLASPPQPRHCPRRDRSGIAPRTMTPHDAPPMRQEPRYAPLINHSHELGWGLLIHGPFPLKVTEALH
jgi:hypothetical protein